MRAKRGIRFPEMVIANSAHAAFYKAAEFFNIRLITVCVFTRRLDNAPSAYPTLPWRVC